MPNIQDVAKAAGVSTATVSHVINGTRFVSEQTRQCVIRAMEELDYHPNLAARSLRSQRSNIVGLLVPDISNPFFMTMIKGVEKVLTKAGYNLLVSDSDDLLDIEKKKLKVFQAQMVDGLIIRTTEDDHSFLNEYLTDCPVVFVDCEPKNYDRGDRVLVDNLSGARKGVDLLLRRGHKRVGMIGGILGLSSTQERIQGYIESYDRHGLKVDRNLIKSGDSRIGSGFALARELIEEEEVTALFTGNNLITIGAMTFIKESGLRIPQDVAVIGFDDQEWSSITEPPLTTIRQPSYEMGETAAKMLLRRISADRMKVGEVEPEEVKLPVELVVRSSC